ncbi:chaplin family protein [Streptomyces sp. NBC_00144]
MGNSISIVGLLNPAAANTCVRCRHRLGVRHRAGLRTPG